MKLTVQISLAEVKNKLKRQDTLLAGPVKDYLAINYVQQPGNPETGKFKSSTLSSKNVYPKQTGLVCLTSPYEIMVFISLTKMTGQKKRNNRDGSLRVFDDLHFFRILTFLTFLIFRNLFRNAEIQRTRN